MRGEGRTTRRRGEVCYEPSRLPTDWGSSTGKFLVELENMSLKSRRQKAGDPEGAGGSLQGSWDCTPSGSGGWLGGCLNI